MKTIFADFNATTESGHVSLTCRGSAEDIRVAELKVGDWAWLSDGELVVGAQLKMDPYHGLIGAPDWETLVHLDDENDQDPDKLSTEFQELSQRPVRSRQEEVRIFQILTLLETFHLPVDEGSIAAGILPLKRSAVLEKLKKPDLARIERIEAISQAEYEAEKSGTKALSLANSIGVNAIIAFVNTSEREFHHMAPRILEWVDRFERTSDRSSLEDSTAALVHFNQGMILLRLGRLEDARLAFETAHRLDPNEAVYLEAARLQSYLDERTIGLVIQANALDPVAA